MEAFINETQQAWITAHVHMYEYFGGATRILMPDNTTCKTYLRLQKECHSPSYGAMAAHVAIVMLRYMILSVFQRQDEHHRALGELFFVMLTELEDITFNHSMMILVEAMLQTVKSIFRITDEQLEAFAVEFYSILPEYMQKSLSYTQSRGSEAICHG